MFRSATMRRRGARAALPMITALFAVLIASLCVTTGSRATDAPQRTDTVRLGVIDGPEVEIAEVVKIVAAEKGLTVEIVTFKEYNEPNAALAKGELDANAFQHRPFLEADSAAHGYDLVSVGYTIVQPMGIYSRTLKTLRALPTGARIGVPSDRSNGGRALRLLAERAMIGLSPGARLTPRPQDVMINTRKFQFIEMPAEDLPAALDRLDAAAINGNYAQAAGFDPRTDTIAIENRRSNPYGNILVVRRADENRPETRILLDSFQSPEVSAFLDARFEGAFMPAW
jgi:D-methionine transport system substrate-binding protein